MPPEEIMLMSSEEEPASYSEASRKKEWIQAMNDEIASIEKEQHLELSRTPKRKEANWIEMVARIETVRVILTLTDLNRWCVHHLNMKSAFLNGNLNEEHLGIEVNQQDKGITLKQEGYAKNILVKTRMLDCNPTKSPMEHKLSLTKDGDEELVNPTEYRSIVGCLRYLTHTRPDITFDVHVASRFMEKPTIKHLQAIKGILRYVKGTLSHGLVYSKGEKVNISGYTDSDLAKDVNDRRSRGGMVFYVN
ncbi:uncharacterized mitochondrial protein AtMg00810-like [Lactuca sativa]|uniref:uncharacterized mitochondrial protein AtMg00810-like n=1 Tax=Lactuca sativa TaxID=4236 RepID=UPI000CD961BC|nr:uncharacterized mitochondrial protein AtMg00810-like [Lactuca sativa]